MDFQLPYMAEYARSGRANCKGCKCSIPKDNLRIAVLVQSAFHDAKVPNWFHKTCFFKNQRPESVGDIQNFENLRFTDQKELSDLIENIKGVIHEKSGKKRSNSFNLALKDFGIEYAKSSRSTCRGCEQKINKDQVRLRKTVYDTEVGMKYGGQPLWHHLDCFAQLRSELGWFDSGENMLGYSSLTYADQTEVKTVLPFDSQTLNSNTQNQSIAKIILQELWLLKLHWDESVPQGIHTAWTSLLQSLTSLESVAIPRYCLQPATCSLEIHGFCDASIRAYGCCVYARTLGSDGLIKVQLITSKSRVAPTKKLSLPKLELCGAHLLSQLYRKIAGIFADREPTIYLWCDSQIVLHWNRQHSATLSTFVGNRISEIQESTADCHWRHVPTHCNPADLLTRGCTVADLQTSIWFQGPAFLRRDQHHWPKDNKEDIDMDVVQLETRKSAFVVRTVNNTLLSGIRKFSSFFCCLLVVAWMYRFSDRSRKGFPTQSLSPTPTELQRA
ncbi:uncharacterized protein Parp1 isoform X3 [Drosophila takahashii]|uniref:uncharacterized protein Parp1 isoform X3 n=1 Tax=Drosophila takahashii TaxID=29030 RepID=UPI0038990D1D